VQAPRRAVVGHRPPAVSLSVKEQLDDKWASAFYECGIPFEVASSEAFREAVETRLGWCACPTMVCIGSEGFGCREGRCKAATRTHTGSLKDPT
jgi:hypothetical protein